MAKSSGWTELGWRRLPFDPDVLAWTRAALPLAQAALDPPDAEWRCGGTWFPGVDALANDATGRVAGVALPASVRQASPIPVGHLFRATNALFLVP